MKILIVFLLSSLVITTEESPKDHFENKLEVCLSSEEIKLYNAINDYRKSKGLSEIALSTSLSYVAQTHSKDLNDNYKRSKKCNMHTWSKEGKWNSCCYTTDHKQAECMWDKPRELTDYSGDGFEIAYAKYKSDESDPKLKAEEALEGWKKSSGHNAVMEIQN